MTADEPPDADTSKPRLLFVEDEVALREHLALKLSDTYIVDTAGNGNEALLAVMRAKPALVVTDIVMPDMDGVELLVTLRQNPGTRTIPVLLISGRALDEYRIEGFKHGADGFLAKPYTERELRALIDSMLRSAHLHAEAAGRDTRDRAENTPLTSRPHYWTASTMLSSPWIDSGDSPTRICGHWSFLVSGHTSCSAAPSGRFSHGHRVPFSKSNSAARCGTRVPCPSKPSHRSPAAGSNCTPIRPLKVWQSVYGTSTSESSSRRT